ncbi:MAG: helix-turn-helix domain-containing protein [Pseudomonadota bacterium]
MSEFSQSLKSWRTARRYSQLDLAHEADISGRHLSFLETGRAQPSREMVAKLSEALQLPLDARNQMLNHAGFAARYTGRDWSDEDMAPIRQAVDRMLTSHLPFPGLAVDRFWTIQKTNAAASSLFGLFGIGKGDSLLDLMTSDILPEFIENWPQVAHHAASRLRTESLAQGGVPELDRAVDHLSKVGGYSDYGSSPVIPTILRLGDLRLSMFSTIAQFGTPEDVTLDDLKIELYYPMDDDATLIFEKMAQD